MLVNEILTGCNCKKQTTNSKQLNISRNKYPVMIITIKIKIFPLSLFLLRIEHKMQKIDLVKNGFNMLLCSDFLC